VILGLDLADGLDVVAPRIDFDLTRLQRAGKRAGQSAAGCGDYVVERGRVRRVAVGIDAVVLGDLGVHAESDRLGLGGQVGESLRPAEPLDPDPGDVGHVAHASELYTANGSSWTVESSGLSSVLYFFGLFSPKKIGDDP
jgi:hypothetical protein